MGGKIERLRQRLVVDVQLLPGGPVPRDLDRVRAGGGLHPDHLEQPRDPRPVLQHELVCAWVDLADDDGVTGLEVGEERIQHAARALHVLT
jgi:hypothetical protein